MPAKWASAFGARGAGSRRLPQRHAPCRQRLGSPATPRPTFCRRPGTYLSSTSAKPMRPPVARQIAFPQRHRVSPLPSTDSNRLSEPQRLSAPRQLVRLLDGPVLKGKQYHVVAATAERLPVSCAATLLPLAEPKLTIDDKTAFTIHLIGYGDRLLRPAGCWKTTGPPSTTRKASGRRCCSTPTALWIGLTAGSRMRIGLPARPKCRWRSWNDCSGTTSARPRRKDYRDGRC